MVGKGTDNPKFDAALRATLDAKLHELGLNTTPWGHAPVADTPHEPVITQDHINGIIGEVMAVCMNAGVTSDVMQRIVNGLNGKLGAPIQQLAECHQKAVGHAAAAASEARASANETPEQKTARLWGEIKELQKTVAEQMEEALKRGDISQAQFDQWRKAQMLADSLPDGDPRKIKATQDAAGIAQPALDGAAEKQEAAGNHEAANGARKGAKGAGQIREKTRELDGHNYVQNKTAQFSSTSTTRSADRTVVTASETPLQNNTTAQPSLTVQSTNASSDVSVNPETETKPPVRRLVRRVVHASQEAAANTTAEPAKPEESPSLPATVVAGLSTVTNSTGTGDTKLPPDARPKTNDGIMPT